MAAAAALRLLPGLLARIRAIVPRLGRGVLEQMACPVSRLAAALKRACDGPPPRWRPAASRQGAGSRAAGQADAECAAVVRTALAGRDHSGRGPVPGRRNGAGHGGATR
jgi:hypothetical protein